MFHMKMAAQILFKKSMSGWDSFYCQSVHCLYEYIYAYKYILYTCHCIHFLSMYIVLNVLHLEPQIQKKKKEKETQQSTSLAFCILTSWTMKTAFQNFF